MTNQTHKVDRSGWPIGEWDNEPDRIDFIHEGFSCMMLRAHGHWCGYVGVPSTHKLYANDDADEYVDVHGGVTYTSKCNGAICHVPEPGMTDDVWWIGFDCHHHMDMSPAMVALNVGLNDGVYRNVEYVTAEVKSLAKQLRDI